MRQPIDTGARPRARWRIAVIAAAIAVGLGGGTSVADPLPWIVTIDHAAAIASAGATEVRLTLVATRRGGEVIELQPDWRWELLAGDDGEVLARGVDGPPWCAGGGELAVAVVVGTAWNYELALPEIRDQVRALFASLRTGCGDRVQLGVLAASVPDGGRGAWDSAAGERLAGLTVDGGAAAPDLLATVERAVREVASRTPLHPGRALRRAVVVIADGRNAPVSRPEAYRRLGESAARDGVRIAAIGYHADGDRRYLLTLAELAARSLGTFRWLPDPRFNPRALERALAALGHELADAPVLAFAVEARALAGRTLGLRLTAGTDQVEARNRVTLSVGPVRGRGHRRWMIALAALAVVAAGSALGAFAVRLRRRQPPRPPAPPDLVAEVHGPALVVEDAAGGPPRRIALRPGLRIGRDPACGLVLADPTVSRVHAEVVSEGGALIIADRSRHGMLINDARVSAAPLRDRMVIRLGSTTLRCELDRRESARS